MSESRFDNIGVVAIGRNEGERLKTCLRSLLGRVRSIVYVDSGSTDDSVAYAESIGVDVVELDTSIPFTAARARNAGAKRLLQDNSDLQYVQFIDGDCEVVDEWFGAAIESFNDDDLLAIVCGRRRERNPDASVYNRLIDLEWDTPVGEATECGGDALIRVEAFEDVGGYDESLIAGEEPEMCIRLRRAGWTIRRIDAEMTLHDADLTKFSQWWRRMVRSGHAAAEGRAMYGDDPERFRVDAVRSTIEWALVLPLLSLSLAWITWGASLLLPAAYIFLFQRVKRHQLKRGRSSSDAGLYARYCVLGKFPELIGMMKFWKNQALGRRSMLIEYKSNESEAMRKDPVRSPEAVQA